jgi:acyl dehydratase
MPGPAAFQSIVTAEARAWADRDYPVHEVDVSRTDIARFAHATGETAPVHFDPATAREAGFDDVVAPPMFYVTLRIGPYNLRPTSEFEPDGTPTDDVPPLPTRRGMAGETELRFDGSIVAGDTISVHKRLIELREKEARSGRLVFLDFEFRYVNQRGQTVVVESFTRILR